MTRYLTVTCTRQRCQATGQAQMHGMKALSLPPHWLTVSYGYDDNAMEFCSLACLEQWAAAMQKAHARQHDWQERKAS